jgi:hypothetical protein
MSENMQLAVVPREPPPPSEMIEGDVLPAPDVLSQVITTCNTKLAATFLVFGYLLRKTDPMYWIDNYQAADVERYGLKKAPFKSRCYYNLVPRNASDVQAAKGIGAAWTSENGQDMLNAYVDGLTKLTPAERYQLLFFCSVLVAEGCRDALRKRQWLIEQIKEIPEEAHWVRVWSDKLFVTFGRNASLETKTQLLGRLGIQF